MKTLQDVFISDYVEASNTLGVTSSKGTIKLNEYNFRNMTKDQRTKTVTHEFGHALGLAHISEKNDYMQQGK